MLKRGFNLLKPQVEPPTIWTKIYDWILGTARIIVVVVEAVVILAFGFRVYVDVEGKALDEKIETEERLMRQFESAETRYRKIQSNTGAFRASWEKSPRLSVVYAEINKHLPQNVTNLKVKIDKDILDISGVANLNQIGELEKQLKNSQYLEKTEVSRVESQSGGDPDKTSFIIRSKVKDVPFRKLT